MQNNKLKVLGVAGLSSSLKMALKKWFLEGMSETVFLIDLDELLEKLLEPGEEAHRQVLNFFGQEFFDKKEQVKKKKLWKFVFENQNKLKILYYLLDPLLMDAVTKEIDLNKDKKVVVFANSFLYEYWNQVFDKVFWLYTNKNEFLSILNEKDLPTSKENYFYVLEKVFVKPKNIEIVYLEKDFDKAISQIVENLK
ncbi:dephospho-CoA kinase [Candidatus Peregrinibacteria bacterium]|nr:dephospho-CoA kinase [Candidatus Peregrinibacteria bacterium]